MTLDSQLTALECAELIRLAQRAPELEYMFRHALIQDASYASLLKSSRRELHRAIGEAIEGLHPEPGDELVPVLARHFEEAGAPERALPYYRQAGERFAAKYANDEALHHFGLAIKMAAAAGAPRRALLHQRARVLELIGASEQARADYEDALAEARASGDRHAQWQTLLDLGFVWVAHDYARAGDCFRQAADLARSIGDQRVLAESLNRLGNWHLNVEQPRQARTCHAEALTLYKAMNDRRGLAETYDLLAIDALVGADLWQGLDALERAIALFRELNDRRGESGALVNRTACTTSIFSQVTVVTERKTDDALADAAEALRIAREIGWRAGIAFAGCNGGMTALGAGKLGLALEHSQAAVQTADAIGHQQWQMLSRFTAAACYAELGDPDRSWALAVEACAIARRIGSAHLLRVGVGVSGQHAAHFGDPSRMDAAEAAIAEALGDETTPGDALTIGQRHCWTGRAEMMRARGDAAGALELCARLDASLPQRGDRPRQHSPYLALVRGECLLDLGRPVEAAIELTIARAIARAAGGRVLWRRAELALARAARMHGESGAEHHASADRLAREMAATIPDAALCARYEARVAREHSELLT